MSTTPRLTPVVNGNDTKQNGSRNGIKPEIELDVSKLHSLPSEQQDLYLFTFVTSLRAYVDSLSSEKLSSQQLHLKKELLQIISLQSPAPTRVIRRGLGDCFARIFTKGDRKILFDSITELAELSNAGKSEKDLKTKHAAVYCLGEIYKAAGDSAINLSGVTSSTLIRLLKPAQSHVALRSAIFKALGRIARAVRGSLDEATARDIWKSARSTASGDRGGLAQVSACWCLEQLIKGTSYFDNTNDFDSLKSTTWKVSDSSSPTVRAASASCLASALIKAYSEKVPERSAPKPKIKKSKKPNQGQALSVLTEEDDSDTLRLGSPTWKKGSIRLELALPDILQQLSSQYVRSSTSNRSRAAIISCYAKVLKGLEAEVVENKYGLIANHLLTDILSNPLVAHYRYRLLLTRRFVQRLLGDVVGHQILGETGQLNAAKTLINEFIKNYPPVIKEKVEPSKNTLTGALNLLASLIKSLGSAFNQHIEICRESLMRVLQHPSYTVQIHTSYCLRLFTQACPRQLTQCASICMENLTKELDLLSAGQQSSRKCVGYANGLSAIISVSPLQPLYSSLEISSQVLKQATNLLKSSGNAELRVSGTQVQVAWILIGGLMSLGPNFVKIHLSQLLLLWRNALPKALTRENAGQRQSAELSYLVHVRECALGSILSFFEFNSRLITTDVSRRIAALLHNTTEFLDRIPADKNNGEMSPRITPSLQLYDLIQMVRRRVLQCYTRLATRSPHTSRDILTQSNLINFSVSCFADPERYFQGSLGTTMTNSTSNFESVWNTADNCGFGISGSMRGLEIRALPSEQPQNRRSSWHSRRDFESDLNQMLLSPICGAREHDSVYLHIHGESGNEELPDPPATEVVNSAIALFAMALPLQDPKIQEGVLEQLTTYLSAKSLARDPGRKAAVAINVALAILGTLKVATSETLAISGDLKYPAVERCLDDLLRMLIIDQDKCIRNAAYEALGRLCNSSGNTFTTNEVNTLVETIVSNREPNARAGCAMALGQIHSNVGGMAAGFHLRKIHGVLMTLCSDPHPTVHFWAVEALSMVAESAGLTFSGYVPSTLGLLAQLWISDSHCEESNTLATSNTEMELPTTVAIAQSLGSLINVLGPDLQDMRQARDLILTLVRQFDLDNLLLVRAQALQCWEHIHLYAPAHVDLSTYVHQLQKGLEADSVACHEIAIDGLYGLMRRNAQQTLECAIDGLEDIIWISLDDPSLQSGIRSIVGVWLSQTSLTHTAQWIARCQLVFSKTVVKSDIVPQNSDQKNSTSAAPDIEDEEVAGFALGEQKDEEAGTTTTSQELLKWQIREFVLQCLSDVLASGGKDFQSNPSSTAGQVLQDKIADVIRIAFLASTSSIVELRIGGLRLIDQVLTIFGRTPDPDFAEALLLEQHQAQISSALTPAFGADSSPELASAALNVCATFIATGLVTDVDRMGRVLKLLVSALSSFTAATEDPVIGDLKGLTSNAQTMVKMAVLSGWAELQIASTEQEYLSSVVKPHVAKLTPLWLSSLQEFARLRFEPDISNSMGVNVDDSLDTVYAALNRQTLLKFYQDSWLELVDAIASLIDQDSDFVFDALDGKSGQVTVNGTKSAGNYLNYRDEPVAFFFVLFGIAFEALVTRPGTDLQDTEDQTLEILQALKKILRPAVAGHAIYQDVVFSETMDLFDRLALTEGLEVQAVIVEITRNLCLSHPSVGDQDDTEEHLSDHVDQLFELTKIIVLNLTSLLPSLGEKTSPLRHQLSEGATSLIVASLKALVDVAGVFPSVIRTDLHACILHMLTTIIGTGACQVSVVPQTLPIFKQFLQTMTQDVRGSIMVTNQLTGCLQRFQSILASAQRREAETSLLCAKNTLLASTILLTSGFDGLSPDEPLVTKLLEDLIDCLQDVGLAAVASNCMRSILLAEAKSNTGQTIAYYLFPRILHFFVQSSTQDPENVKTLIGRTLTMYVSTVHGSNVSNALSFIIPALLHRASIQGKDSYQETAARLLSLAGTDQSAFRGVVIKMSSEHRTFMEEVIREGGGGRRDADREGGERGEPSIALKMTFGSP